MATQVENETLHSLEDSPFQRQLPHYYRAILQGFRRAISPFISFQLFFLALLGGELFLFFFSLFHRSSLLAFAIGIFFLTCFSYFILLFYYQAKKPEQLHTLKEEFLSSCRQFLSPVDAEHHLLLAEALTKLSSYLEDFEWNFYKAPPFLQPLSRILQRFSAYCYGEDVFRMKQLLFRAAIEEHFSQIRITPTDLETHASLANCYVALSRLYRDPFKKKGPPHPRAYRLRKWGPLFEEKSRTTSRLALEEFQILSHYAPNDPWVHEQLAEGYHDLEMPREEMKEVEILLKLRPQDKEILFRLGMLYFQQGENAKGLQVYEELKQSHYKKAEDLIASYGISR